MTAGDAPVTLRPPLALTMGDPAGIGPDIALFAWQRRERDQLPPFVLYADVGLMRERATLLQLDVPIEPIAEPRAAAAIYPHALPIIPIALANQAKPGKPEGANAVATRHSIERAVADVGAGHVAAVVTNPIAKAVLYSAGFSYPGHTEFLGALSTLHWPNDKSTPVMMLVAPDLRVVPVTIHVPLKDVPTLLTTDKIIAVARITASALARDFSIPSPRLAITGLNPHAGEDGTLGTEDREIIAPAVAALRKDGINATGPHSADTLFHAAARKTYDAAIAMYHDQALIPVKTLAFDDGVNTTLGLPFVRTSPDHGTAFAIAGKGTASPASLIAALKLAAEMSARRQYAKSDVS